MKKYVKVEQKVLFEICDAILSHDGGFNYDTCPENENPYFVSDWGEDFLAKVRNVRDKSKVIEPKKQEAKINPFEKHTWEEHSVYDCQNELW